MEEDENEDKTKDKEDDKEGGGVETMTSRDFFTSPQDPQVTGTA